MKSLVACLVLCVVGQVSACPVNTFSHNNQVQLGYRVHQVQRANLVQVAPVAEEQVCTCPNEEQYPPVAASRFNLGSVNRSYSVNQSYANSSVGVVYENTPVLLVKEVVKVRREPLIKLNLFNRNRNNNNNRNNNHSHH